MDHPAGASLEITGLTKTFGGRAKALSSCGFRIMPGEMVALIGASGSGKSTMLRHVSGFIAADRGGGTVRVDNNAIQANGRIDRRVRRMRADVGFVFQQFNLVGRLSVLINVLVGLIARVPAWRALTMHFTREEKAEAMRALAQVGIRHLAWQRASTLSGGQQQRVAIARALVQAPLVLLADEPVASLDPRTAREVLQLLTGLAEARGMALVCSLHQPDLAARYFDRVLELKDGRLVAAG